MPVAKASSRPSNGKKSTLTNTTTWSICGLTSKSSWGSITIGSDCTQRWAIGLRKNSSARLIVRRPLWNQRNKSACSKQPGYFGSFSDYWVEADCKARTRSRRPLPIPSPTGTALAIALAAWLWPVPLSKSKSRAAAPETKGALKEVPELAA